MQCRLYVLMAWILFLLLRWLTFLEVFCWLTFLCLYHGSHWPVGYQVVSCLSPILPSGNSNSIPVRITFPLFRLSFCLLLFLYMYVCLCVFVWYQRWDVTGLKPSKNLNSWVVNPQTISPNVSWFIKTFLANAKLTFAVHIGSDRFRKLFSFP